MIKKLLSLISVVAMLVTIAVPMASAEYRTASNSEETKKGINMYAYDDFEDYNVGVARTTTKTTMTTTVGDVVNAENGKNITELWSLKYSNGTYSATHATFPGKEKCNTSTHEIVYENGTSGNKAFKYTVTSSLDANAGITVNSAAATAIKNDTSSEFFVISAKMMNGGTDTADSGFNNFKVGSKSVKVTQNSIAYDTSNTTKNEDAVAPTINQHEWFDYMLVFKRTSETVTVSEEEKTVYSWQAVLNGEPTELKGTFTENLPSVIAYRPIGETSTNGVMMIDNLAYYGVDVDAEEFGNNYTVTDNNDKTITVKFDNPTTLKAEHIKVMDASGTVVTDANPSISFADGKFTVKFEGLETITDYTATITGATDVFGYTAETKTFDLKIAAEPRDVYLTEDGSDNTTHEKLKLQPAAAADKVNVVWAQDSTALDADGKTNGAIKATITDKTEETISSEAEITGGQLMNTEWPTGAWGGKRFVTKARLRFGEADGTNAPSQMVFANVVLFSNGAVRRNDSTLWDGTVLAKTSVDGLYEAGKWFDVEAVVDLDVPDQENVDGKTYANVVYKTSFSINGKHIFDVGNTYTQNDDGTVKLHQYQMLVRNIKPVAGADYNCVYVDDISMYAISKEKAEATVLSAADKSVQFKTEHALKDFAAAKLSATVNGNAATISDVAVNNGIYSVILENALAAGDEVVITSNIADVVGNKLTETIKATAGSPTISKLSLNSSGNLRFLTLNSSYTSKDAVLFIATYDGNKLDSIKKIDVTVKPGTNYYKATVSGSYVRTFLFSSVDTLMPLMAE